MPLTRPVKVQCLITGRYVAGNTENVSAGGALLVVNHPSVMVPGQRVRVGIADHPRAALLTQESFSDATVIRSLGMGGSQRLAIQFDQPQALAIAG